MFVQTWSWGLTRGDVAALNVLLAQASQDDFDIGARQDEVYATIVRGQGGEIAAILSGA